MWTLSVSDDCAMRNFQRAPFTIRRFFQEGSSPQGGSSVKSLLAFVKTLCKLGKQIEVRKSEKDKKAKHQPNKPRKNDFSLPV